MGTLAFGLSQPLGAQEPQSCPESERVAIEARIVDKFNETLLIVSVTGRLLAEPLGGAAGGAETGALVRMEGCISGDKFFWSRLLPVDIDSQQGRTLVVQMIEARLHSVGLSSLDPPLAIESGYRVLATREDGLAVVAKFSRYGTLQEVEDSRKRANANRGMMIPDDTILNAARRAGFQPAGAVRRKSKHFELEARTRSGELVELHIDHGLRIYKQKWLAIY